MTGAFAFAAARVMRSGFSPASLPAFDEAIRLAAVCSRADALDVFCDGIAAMVSMTPAEREAAVETFHSDVACATC